MSLQVWLPLTKDLSNQGLSDATFSYVNNNGKLAVNTSGKLGSCYERTASGYADLFRSSTTFNLSGDLSMCCWAYVSATIGDTANGLITNHNHADNTSVGITVKQVSPTDYRICCSTGTGSSRTYNTYYGTTNIKDAWHHLALTYTKSTKVLQLWVDGVVEYTLNNYANASGNNAFELFNWSTGYGGNAQFRPVCKLNDVRLYDHCLSAKEVKEHWWNGFGEKVKNKFSSGKEWCSEKWHNFRKPTEPDTRTLAHRYYSSKRKKSFWQKIGNFFGFKK